MRGADRPDRRAVLTGGGRADNTSGTTVRHLFAAQALVLLCGLAGAQAAAPPAPPPAAPAPAVAATGAEGTDGFRAIRLGMRLEETKRALQDDPYFVYRGDPDVSFLPLSQRR